MNRAQGQALSLDPGHDAAVLRGERQTAVRLLTRAHASVADDLPNRWLRGRVFFSRGHRAFPGRRTTSSARFSSLEHGSNVTSIPCSSAIRRATAR